MQLADAVYSAENERLVEDLQDKLEEARSELSQRRKDEKEMKGKERAQAIQISGVSGNVRFQQAGPKPATKPGKLEGESREHAEDVQLAVW